MLEARALAASRRVFAARLAPALLGVAAAAVAVAPACALAAASPPPAVAAPGCNGAPAAVAMATGQGQAGLTSVFGTFGVALLHPGTEDEALIKENVAQLHKEATGLQELFGKTDPERAKQRWAEYEAYKAEAARHRQPAPLHVQIANKSNVLRDIDKRIEKKDRRLEQSRAQLDKAQEEFG